MRLGIERATIDLAGIAAERLLGPPLTLEEHHERIAGADVDQHVREIQNEAGTLRVRAAYSGNASDSAHVERGLLALAEGDACETEAAFRWIECRARRLVNEHRAEILRLADALLERGRLDHEDVEDLLDPEAVLA